MTSDQAIYRGDSDLIRRQRIPHLGAIIARAKRSTAVVCADEIMVLWEMERFSADTPTPEDYHIRLPNRLTAERHAALGCDDERRASVYRTAIAEIVDRFEMHAAQAIRVRIIALDDGMSCRQQLIRDDLIMLDRPPAIDVLAIAPVRLDDDIRRWALGALVAR